MFRMLIPVLALAACTGASVNSNGEPEVRGPANGWFRIAVTRLGATYTNRNAVVTQGDEFRVTEYTLWFPAAETEMERTENQHLVRCRDRTVRDVHGVQVYPGGRRVSEPVRAERVGVTPGTSGEYNLRFHCGETNLGAPLDGSTPEEDFRRLRR